MKSLFIIPSKETSVLPNQDLYCKVYKGTPSELVEQFHINPKYQDDCEWLIELETDSIPQYIQFYKNCITKQLEDQTKLTEKDYKEVETELDIMIILYGILQFHDYLTWKETKLFRSNLVDLVTEYDNKFTNGTDYLSDCFDLSDEYIKYWYNFNR